MHSQQIRGSAPSSHWTVRPGHLVCKQLSREGAGLELGGTCAVCGANLAVPLLKHTCRGKYNVMWHTGIHTV